MRAPSAWNFFGFSRNSLISCSSSTASSTPATSRNVIFGESTDIRLARDLPNDITFEPPPWTWFIRNSQNPMKMITGRIQPIMLKQHVRACRLDVEVVQLARGLLPGAAC